MKVATKQLLVVTGENFKEFHFREKNFSERKKGIKNALELKIFQLSPLIGALLLLSDRTLGGLHTDIGDIRHNPFSHTGSDGQMD